MRIEFDKGKPLVGGFLSAKFQSASKPSISVQWSASNTLTLPNSESVPLESSVDVVRALLHGEESTTVRNALANQFLELTLDLPSGVHKTLEYLDLVLRSSTFLLGTLSAVDFAVYGAIWETTSIEDVQKGQPHLRHLQRWLKAVQAVPVLQAAIAELPNDIQRQQSPIARIAEKRDSSEAQGGQKARPQEGKFIELPGAERGKVVVRFPPEASGYLHIGHAKAALLNQYYQQAYQGQLIMRFDDTNPAKENVHFEEVILKDVEMLEIKPDRFTYTSDYFELMLGMCERLIKEGKAFADDTPGEQMKTEREQKVNSANRDNSIEKNLSMWNEMKLGTAKGIQCCVRAKMFMQSFNGCMRDPTIYRCKPESHPRTGNKYKVYPTYDFACPIVDAIEEVTHVLRTTEYHDRDDQFFWFIEALGLRRPHIWEYSRLNMTNTVLSKRKLTWFVDEGLVDGWDDPRMPTVRGILRRGMTVAGLREFIKSQGSSRSVVFMEWDKIWAINKKVIDAVAPRYTALQSDPPPVPVDLRNANVGSKRVPLHPKNASVGEKTVWISRRILIDQADARTLKEGELTTFINYGNVLIDKINRDSEGRILSVDATPKLENEDYKKTLKLTWLADAPEAAPTPTFCVYFDHIISKPVLGKDDDYKQHIGHETRREVEMIGDPGLRGLKEGDIIQLQRRGFFRVDVAATEPSAFSGKARPCVLFHVPDGHTSERLQTAIPLKQPAPVDAKPSVAQSPSADESSLLARITEQGEKVRDLKTKKAEKSAIDSEVQTLLTLKRQFKEATGKDWKPELISKKPIENEPTIAGDRERALLARISRQGDAIRQLKEGKSAKSAIDPEVRVLLALKQEYKDATGRDWKPDTAPKEKEVDRKSVAAETQTLLSLKRQYREATGEDWKPESLVKLPVSDEPLLAEMIAEHNAKKSTLDVEAQIAFALKIHNMYAMGKDWRRDPTTRTKETSPASDESGLLGEIADQGAKVRQLKEQKAEKAVIDAEVRTLLGLKKQYKEATGKEWKPAVAQKEAVKTAKEKIKKEKTPPKAPDAVATEKSSATSSGPKKQTRLGLEARKSDDLPEWYSQVITKGELIEYYDVSGCYILRPWAYMVWDAIRSHLSARIRALGVEDCYFPIFVSKAALEREKTHIADFAPEVAWVTRSGDSDLAEPIAVRPTSETVMYPSYAKWIQSHRDLPIKLNQWNNVVRWEFQHPQPFLRTREFLWQEGHTAYEDQESAHEEVVQILDYYREIYEDLMAIPVVRGRKTDKEQFAGGDYTLTVEAFVPASGRGIQGATSHHLGQNFSKMFEIVYNDPKTQEKKYVYQNSWGITTRTIGVLIMVHGDDRGLVMPPRVAPLQAVIVPCGVAASTSTRDRDALIDSCSSLERDLKTAGVRAKGDYRDNYSPGWKFNHWELKGVPIRIEIGPKDMAADQLVAVKRATGEKLTLKRATAVGDVQQLLETIHHDMLKRATEERDARISTVADWTDFVAALDDKNIILATSCTQIPCEEQIKKDSARSDVSGEAADSKGPAMGAKALCIPLDQPRAVSACDRCINPKCTNTPTKFVLFGRSY